MHAHRSRLFLEKIPELYVGLGSWRTAAPPPPPSRRSWRPTAHSEWTAARDRPTELPTLCWSWSRRSLCFLRIRPATLFNLKVFIPLLFLIPPPDGRFRAHMYSITIVGKPRLKSQITLLVPCFAADPLCYHKVAVFRGIYLRSRSGLRLRLVNERLG